MKLRLLLSLSVAAALAAVILSPAAGAASAKPCSSKNLVIWAGPKMGGGTAGGYEYEITFTNLGSAACTLKGAPAVGAVDLKGKRIGAAASTVGGKKATITLAPGQAASADALIADAINFPKNKCEPTMAAGLKVGVPGGSGGKVAPIAFETCAKASARTISVQPVTATVEAL
jgi:hypothetical protein